MNKVLENANHALLSERKRNSEATVFEDGSAQIAINPFIESGNSIMEETYRDLEKALGAEKFEQFEKMAREEINRSLKQFGAEVASYTITLETDRSAIPNFRYTRRTETEHGYSTSSGVLKSLDHQNWAAEEINKLVPKDKKSTSMA